MEQNLLTILAGIVAVYLLILVLSRPYLGIAITVATLPVVDLLPSVPFLSSVVPLVGGVVLLGYLVQKRHGPVITIFSLDRLHILALLFILWIFVSNPLAAWSGGDRNWIFTFLQLFILMVLSGELLDNPQKQRTVMAIFSVSAIISAFYAIQTGQINETFDTSIRAEGFVDNANAAARFFVVAMVFLTYLRSASKNSVLKLLCLIGIFITYLGVFYTVSRTGMLLLFGAQGLILLMQVQVRQRVGILIIFAIGLAFLWLFADSIFGIIQTILPTIINREDTFGLRINLWRSGWEMWLDHPIRGVGIGMYIKRMGPYSYSLPGPQRWNAVAHNTYIQILSETGIVGFVVFMLMFFTALKNFWKSPLIKEVESLALRNAWLIAFIVMLLGGITKSDHADKLTWMVMGVSLYFSPAPQSMKEKTALKKSPSVRSILHRRVSQNR